MLKKLTPYLGKYKLYALITPLFMIGEVAMELMIPYLMSEIIDKGIGTADAPGKGVGYVAFLGAVMVLMALISLAFGFFGGKFAAIAGAGFAKNLRQGLYYKVQDFSFANTDRFSTASLVTRLTTDVTNTQNAFQMLMRMAIRAPFSLVGALIMASVINGKLALIFLVVIPVLAVAIVFAVKTTFPRFKVLLEKYDRLNAIVEECLVAIRVVKAFVRGDYEEEKFNDAADTLRNAQVRAEKILVYGMPFVQVCMYASIITVIFLGGQLVLDGTMESGKLISFVSYISQILMNLIMLAMIFINLVLSRASISRIVEVLDEVPDIAGIDSDLKVADGSIEFENVSFSYTKKDDNLALEGINLSIASGETIGIIGGTGSSKSTLVQLIPRLYDVQSGSVKVGGHDVREYSLRTLRDSVAMVLQKNVLFSGTIRDNLRWGNKHATDEEIIEACMAAQAHDFIMSFPDGYDTDLGQGGVNVSGGQKQRLCIARALLKKPQIIILDDSTSAVDTATDSKIRAAFREQLSDTTTIIIAQRISSVSDADKIIVLDDGKISAIGTHEELLEKSDIYREVYESQQKGVDE